MPEPDKGLALFIIAAIAIGIACGLAAYANDWHRQTNRHDLSAKCIAVGGSTVPTSDGIVCIQRPTE